jgi:thiol-disulfide isomerase/thioredoxin
LSHAISLGPLLLPLTLVLVFASAGSTLAVGRWLARDAHAHAETVLWHALLVGVVVARLAFVYEYRGLYLSSPLAILDIRDGGWEPAFGIAGGWLFVLRHERKTPALRKPLRGALAAGTALFVIGMAVLSITAPTGQKMPELAFTSLDGRTVRLNDFSGKPIVVNLWATWCPPCRREMPVLQEAQARHPEVDFVILNQGEDAVRVTRWLEGERLALRNVLLDPKREASAAFKQKGYPTTLFFNAQGELVASRVGELSAATLAEKLQASMR